MEYQHKWYRGHIYAPGNPMLCFVIPMSLPEKMIFEDVLERVKIVDAYSDCGALCIDRKPYDSYAKAIEGIDVDYYKWINFDKPMTIDRPSIPKDIESNNAVWSYKKMGFVDFDEEDG